MAMTPLVRLTVVFHFLRQALGTQTAPSNPTLLGLALMMTWFLMTQVDQQAVEPFRSGQITGMEAIDRGAQPVKHFMLHYAREKDLALFTAAGRSSVPTRPMTCRCAWLFRLMCCRSLAGFAIGAVLFLPFLLIEIRSRPRLPPRSACSSAGGGVHAAQDSAVCDGGRLEPVGQLAVEEFLEIPMTTDMAAELLRC